MHQVELLYWNDPNKLVFHGCVIVVPCGTATFLPSDIIEKAADDVEFIKRVLADTRPKNVCAIERHDEALPKICAFIWWVKDPMS